MKIECKKSKNFKKSHKKSVMNNEEENMTTELLKIDKNEANSFLINTLFDYLDSENYLDIIYGTKGQVPGFTKKNAAKAPKTLIKNIAKQRVKKLTNALQFLTKYTIEFIDDYKDLTFHEFYPKIHIDSNLTDGQKLALFFILFNEEYKEYKEIINKNIKENLSPLANILPQSFSEQLETVHSFSNERELIKDIKISEYFDLDKKWLFEEEMVKKWRSIYLPPPDEGYYLYIYKNSREEIESWNADESVTFLKLVIGDFISLVKKQTASYEEIFKGLKDEIEFLKNENIRLNKSVDSQIENNASLEKEIENYTKELDKLHKMNSKLSGIIEEKEKSIKELNEKITQYLKNLDTLKEKNEDLKRRYEEKKKEGKRLEEINLFRSEDFYFITKMDVEKYKPFFSNDQLISLEEVKDLNAILKMNGKESVYFINVDGISTRDSFKLEQPLKRQGLTYRLVSGGFENVMRKIIYLLEGELKYEIKEKY